MIDVRRQEEWDLGHIDGAHHVPVHRIADAELPTGRSGFTVPPATAPCSAASLLWRLGRDVVAVNDSWDKAHTAGLLISSTVTV